jgi:hypothetical protein
MPYNVLVMVYSDSVLFSLMPLWDAGVMTDEGLIQRSLDSFVLQAKGQLRDQNRLTEAQIDNFQFVVERQ